MTCMWYCSSSFQHSQAGSEKICTVTKIQVSFLLETRTVLDMSWSWSTYAAQYIREHRGVIELRQDLWTRWFLIPRRQSCTQGSTTFSVDWRNWNGARPSQKNAIIIHAHCIGLSRMFYSEEKTEVHEARCVPEEYSGANTWRGTAAFTGPKTIVLLIHTRCVMSSTSVLHVAEYERCIFNTVGVHSLQCTHFYISIADSQRIGNFPRPHSFYPQQTHAIWPRNKVRLAKTADWVLLALFLCM
jgi:hypothetical protein